MTDRPRLYPSHQHQWADADPQFFHAGLVRCTVCGFQAPRKAAGLDGQMTEPETVWQRCDNCPNTPGPCACSGGVPQPEQETR